MAQQWSEIAAEVTEDCRLKVSVLTHLEEPGSLFIDIRRTYEQNGRVQPTRRGIRTTTSTTLLQTMADALQEIGGARLTEITVGKLHFLRCAGALQVRKEVEEEQSAGPLLILTPAEVIFVVTRILMFKKMILENPLPAVEGDDGEVWF